MEVATARGTDVPRGNRRPCKVPGATLSACAGAARTPPASALREPYADGDGPRRLLRSLAGLTPGPRHQPKNCTQPLGAPHPVT